MRKRIGIACWWLGTVLALALFCISFYWLISSDADSANNAFMTLSFIPLVTGPLWAISYLLAGAFWEESD